MEAITCLGALGSDVPQPPGKRRKGDALLSWLGCSSLIIEPNNAVRETETQLAAMILVPRKPCIRSWLPLGVGPSVVRCRAAPSSLLRVLACTGMCTSTDHLTNYAASCSWFLQTIVHRVNTRHCAWRRILRRDRTAL